MFQKIFRDVSHGLGHFSPMFHIISYIYIAIVACSYVEKRVTSVELYIFSNSIVITIETTNFVLIHVISMVVWRKFGYLTPYSPVANCSPSPPPTPFFREFATQFLNYSHPSKLQLWETKFDIPKSLPILQSSCTLLHISHGFRYIFHPSQLFPPPSGNYTPPLVNWFIDCVL